MPSTGRDGLPRMRLHPNRTKRMDVESEAMPFTASKAYYEEGNRYAWGAPEQER